MMLLNSMSDLFHKQIPKGYISQVFDAMEKADWHIYQVLTKRSSLAAAVRQRPLQKPEGTRTYLARRIH